MNIGSNYIVGIWVASLPGLWNWLGTVVKNDDGSYSIETRTRLEMDDKIWDSQDPKFWEDFTVPAGAQVSEEMVMEQVALFREMKVKKLLAFHQMMFQEDASLRVQRDDIILQTKDGEAIIQELKKYPYMNISQISPSVSDPNNN